tara:strand:+ start:10718 stop:11518 length:801 start_codon:yes stop_codon:yes gene_type:complete
MRVLVIGDIHGNCKGLLDVLDACGYDKEYDQLICVGDYVDGWSESFEVVDFLIDLALQAIHKPIFLRGNHDVWCEEYLHGQVKNLWLTQGGQATLKSYQENNEHLDMTSHKKFFRGLHNYYVDKENRGFVHGGFVSKRGIGHDPYQSNYYWDRDMWSLAVMLHGREHEATGVSSATRFRKHKEVYIGHTSTLNWKCKPHLPEYNNDNQIAKNGDITVPMNRCNVWNMDTGGGFKGKLSIMDIDTKQVWQADYTKKLYPGEMGHYKK